MSLQVTVLSTEQNSRLRRTSFVANGRKGEIITRTVSERAEVYREHAEHPGLFMFLGYFDELGPLVQRTVEPAVRIHRGHIPAPNWR
jgi:hypothetical protein